MGFQLPSSTGSPDFWTINSRGHNSLEVEKKTPSTGKGKIIDSNSAVWGYVSSQEGNYRYSQFS